MWTERADPGDAQLCSGHVLPLRNVGQGIDDGKVVPHRLTTNGESPIALDISYGILRLLGTEEDDGGNHPLHDNLVSLTQ